MITQEAVEYIRDAVMYYMDSGLANTRYPEHVVEIIDDLQYLADRRQSLHNKEDTE